VDAQSAYEILDAVSSVLTLGVAASFFLIARWSRKVLHLLVATGFMLIGAGFLFVSLSHYGADPGADVVDSVRILFQLTGALMLFLAYATHHGGGRPHTVAVAFGAFGGTVGMGILFWLLPTGADAPPLPAYFASADAVMTIAYLGCSGFAGYGWHKHPTWNRALVPLAFLGWAFSKYTWIFVVLGPDDRFLGVVYAWRFFAIALLLIAVAHRPRMKSRGGGHAPS
jgi:hypothetical protein